MTNDERRLPDHESDPAHIPGDGWVDEGGASHSGPATHISSGHAEQDSSTSEEDEGSAD